MAGGRVAVAMSGGVDSSMAALILKEAGWDPIGFSMKLWDRKRNMPGRGDRPAGGYGDHDDFRDAREVAARLNIPYHIVDFQEAFERTIIRSFVRDYRSGYTPSPCVRCNAHMKFDRLIRLAREVGAPRVATGHYARIARDDASGRYRLLRAGDKRKDQSYFLFELRQSQLEKAVFPLGDMKKEEVREIAGRFGLAVADKSESQEICFIPDGDYAAFIERYSRRRGGNPGTDMFPSGPIVDPEGRVLGRHPGIHHFTIGQRRGLGIAHATPLYVLELCPEGNRVVVGTRSQLEKRCCRVVRPNWISIARLSKPLRVKAKIRSRHPEAPATITPKEDGSIEVVFDKPQPAVSPGQACVFYQDAVVVGGGWIERDDT